MTHDIDLLFIYLLLFLIPAQLNPSYNTCIHYKEVMEVNVWVSLSKIWLTIGWMFYFHHYNKEYPSGRSSVSEDAFYCAITLLFNFINGPFGIALCVNLFLQFPPSIFIMGKISERGKAKTVAHLFDYCH